MSGNTISAVVLHTVSQATKQGAVRVTTSSTLAALDVDFVICSLIVTDLRTRLGIIVTVQEILCAADLSSLIEKVTAISLSPDSMISLCPRVQDDGKTAPAQETFTRVRSPNSTTRTESSVPLSVLLQGQPDLHATILFLLPDGSGAASSYSRLPPLGEHICLYAMNSPYVKTANPDFCIETATKLWTAEIRRIQPHGPYHLGGWSAGGYWAFEVARELINAGEAVASLTLIDSPCRTQFEALPMDVVRFLAATGRLGDNSSKSPPAWVLTHFEACINAIETYSPKPLSDISNSTTSGVRKVFVIWAEDPVLKDELPINPAADRGLKVTKFMLEQRSEFGTLGWETLLPGVPSAVATTTGTHFSLMFQPHVKSIATLLRHVLESENGDLPDRWTLQ